MFTGSLQDVIAAKQLVQIWSVAHDLARHGSLLGHVASANMYFQGL